MTDDGESAVRRLNNIRDVVRAIAVASEHGLRAERVPFFSRDFLKKSAHPTSKKSLKRPRCCYTFACVGVPSVTSAA